MDKIKIMVIDDSNTIRKSAEMFLTKAGHQVVCIEDGFEALTRINEEDPDLVFIDVLMPKIDGLQACQVIKRNPKFKNTPVIFLSSKDSQFDKARGFMMGATDYLTKPFSPKEVVARIKAILRRVKKSEQKGFNSIKVGDLVIYPERYEAEMNSNVISFTRKEFELLYYLASNKGKVVSRDQLLSGVWDYDFVGDTRIVDVHISHLREKIEPDTKKPIYIKTVRGLGYKLEEPNEVHI